MNAAWVSVGLRRASWPAVIVVAMAGALLPRTAEGPARALEPIVLEVTTSADAVASPTCPDATRCTLRRAIEVANADASGAAIRIVFSESAFPHAQPATIVLSPQPLPVVTRDDVTIDAAGRGVVLAGNTSSVTPSLDGLVFSGARAGLRGLTIHGFVGTCLRFTGASAVVGGDPAAGSGNSIDGCGVGIRVDGPDTTIYGNSIGFAAPQPGAESVGAGIWVTAANAHIGPAPQGDGFPNRIGNADTAIRIGGIGTAALTGIRVSRNVIGGDVNESAAPVQTGLRVLAPVSGAAVTSNSIANARTGIAIQGSATGPSAMKVSVQANVFRDIGALAIDLNDDGVRNLNDADDTDTGANGLLNTPVFSRAVQSRVSGSACPGCVVQMYVADHFPGGTADYGTRPVPGGVLTADGTGAFTFVGAAVSPGDWLVALATDADGNTSEFSGSARVGAGSVQCGNASLRAGWNLVGYFGSEPVSLGADFPVDGAGAGAVRAIYRLDTATSTYASWLAGAAAGRTLNTLEPGETYWMLARAPVVLAGGFSVSAPVPVDLHAGWNTIVYIGATAPVADAFASIAGKYSQLLAWSAESQAWSRFGDPAVPAWAQDFGQAQACTAYQLFATESATLIPLQP